MIIKRLFLLACLAVGILISLLIMLFNDYQAFLKTPVNIASPYVFTIEPGASFKEINGRLKENGVIANHNYFEFLARHANKSNKIKHGEYKLTPGLKPDELLDIFVTGNVIQYSFTIIEGWQIREMLAAIQETDLLDKELANYEPENLMSELGLPDKSPEGLFFPDTYLFPRGTSDKQFLLRAYQTLQQVLEEEWKNRAASLPYQSSYEALTMASIIEKETGLPSEREKIAGVFVRRLNKNMKLQTDPTVIFAMGQSFNGNIRKKDLSIDSPYNTYRYKGLPPGPIALVGREAIHAALHPEDGKELYFVSKGDGSHYFSETLKEHNQAVAKYQLNR